MAKADARKQTEWRKRLKRFESSGLTIAQFCRNEEVPLHTFYYWGKRLGRPSKGSRHSGSRQPGGKAGGVSPEKGAGAMNGEDYAPLVHFAWGSKLRMSVPADCVDAIRCVLEYANQEQDERRDAAGAFREVILAE